MIGKGINNDTSALNAYRHWAAHKEWWDNAPLAWELIAMAAYMMLIQKQLDICPKVSGVLRTNMMHINLKEIIFIR